MEGNRADRSLAAASHDDGAEAMREWRWRCYTDHLEDMGYDLEGGEPSADEVPGRHGGGGPDRGSASGVIR